MYVTKNTRKRANKSFLCVLLVTSTYFLPLLRLAYTYLVIKDARMAAGITEPAELHELGYEGTDSLGGVRAPRADGDGAAAQPPSARWEGITDSAPNCLKDRIHAIGRALPAGTRTFPSITEKDIASVVHCAEYTSETGCVLVRT